MSPANKRFSGHMDVLLAVAFVVRVLASDRSRACRERVADVPTKCLAGLVEADDWTVWVVGFVVEIEDSFHPVDELGVLFGRNEPVFRAVWLQVALFCCGLTAVSDALTVIIRQINREMDAVWRYGIAQTASMDVSKPCQTAR
jgi:hypothetical protein